jgi:hypothetical protein
MLSISVSSFKEVKLAFWSVNLKISMNENETADKDGVRLLLCLLMIKMLKQLSIFRNVKINDAFLNSNKYKEGLYLGLKDRERHR